MQTEEEDLAVAAAIAASEAEAAETARVRRAEQVALDHALAASVAEAEAAEAALLYAAARHGREADVAALLEGGSDVNALDPNGSGETALCAACKHGQINVVTVLIDAGAEVNQADLGGQTPLILACIYSFEVGRWQSSRTVVAKLLAANANVDQARNDGRTPMYFACARGHRCGSGGGDSLVRLAVVVVIRVEAVRDLDEGLEILLNLRQQQQRLAARAVRPLLEQHAVHADRLLRRQLHE